MLSDTLTLEVSKCKTYTTSNIDIGLTTIPILLSYQIPNTICISILASFLTSSLTVYFNLWITEGVIPYWLGPKFLHTCSSKLQDDSSK